MKTMMKTNGDIDKIDYLIIYHKEDNDGVFSAAILYDYIVRTFSNLTVEFLGANYNDLNNIHDELYTWIDKYKNVIMVDISFNDISCMKTLYNLFNNNFIYIDHHAPIIAEIIKNGLDIIPGIRETNRSAILCTYKYLYDQFDEEYKLNSINKLYTILSAYDSFTWDNHNLDKDYCVSINKAVTFKYNLDINKVYDLIKNIYTIDIDELIDDLHRLGCDLSKYDNCNWDNIINLYGDNSWLVETNEGLRKACALFLQGQSTSLMFSSCDKEIKNGIVFKHLPDSNWIISLYNIDQNDDFHCGDFMKLKYDGGGHKGASGATVSQRKFINILKDKRI